MNQTNKTTKCPQCGRITLQGAKACVICGHGLVTHPVKQVNLNIQGLAPKQLTPRDQKLTVISGILFAVAFIFLSAATDCAGPR